MLKISTDTFFASVKKRYSTLQRTLNVKAFDGDISWPRDGTSFLEDELLRVKLRTKI
jgi:hypothetical protein